MAILPDDVLSNIFIRLLAKQLAQMRCVCKPWNALLSESWFIKSHLHHSINNKDKILLFFQKNVFFASSPGPLLTARPSQSPHLEHTNVMKKLKLPINPQHNSGVMGHDVHVIGSENGLICVAYSSSIRIWNPSLSALLTLPPSSLSYSGCHLGFGFDPKTDDYKVVKLGFALQKPNPMVSETHGEVYSMRKSSWESITHMVPSHIQGFIHRNEVCVNGHLHWLSVIHSKRNPQPQTIVAFDLAAMTFREIPLPDSILLHDGIYHINELGVLGGKLCLMSRILDGQHCDVWVMDDDDATWVKHHAFSQLNVPHIIPHGFTSHNEFVFQVDRGCHFALYDPVADKTKNFNIKLDRRQIGAYKIFEYVDSLVWITPANGLQI